MERRLCLPPSNAIGRLEHPMLTPKSTSSRKHPPLSHGSAARRGSRPERSPEETPLVYRVHVRSFRAAGVNFKGATPFWRAAYALDVDAMRLLKKHGADPNIPTIKPPRRRRRGGDSGGFSKSLSKTFKRVVHFFHMGNPEVPVGGPSIYPLHAAADVGYGQSFAGNAHRYVPRNWVPAVKFLIEECGGEVDIRDQNGYTALHHAASRGDNELVLYLVEQGADVTAKSRKGQTTADMANGPIERVVPFPETIALLTKLGAKNNNRCVSC